MLLAIGAVLGWAASILTRSDDGKSILRYILAGIVGSLAAGALASGESLVLGLSATALLFAIAGAAAVIAVLHYTHRRSVG